MSIPAHLIEQARSVPVENVIAERGIKMRGTADRCGPCPRCGGEDRFSIHVGKQVFNCRECGAKGDVIALTQFLDGIDFRSAVERLSGEKIIAEASTALGPIKAIYDYTDEAGKLLFQALRFEPAGRDKQFRQRTGPNQKKWSIDGVRIVPFRLPELIEDIALDHVVFIVEGEKDVLTLRSLNVPATTNAMGAGKWRESFNEIFHDADVVVCGDNDAPGRAHVELVAQNLHGVAKRVRVLDLAQYWPDIGDGDDITNWFDRGGGTVERLHEIVAGIPSWTPKTKGNGADAKAPNISKFKIEPFEAIKFDAVNEWRIKRVLPQQGVGPIYGASESFKSFVALHLALHVALGWKWAERRVKQCPAFYIAAEGSAGLRKRKAGLELAHHDDLTAEVPFYLISTAPNLGTDKGDLATLIAAIEVYGVKPGLIVIDTLAQSLGGADENNSGMVAFVANATALANHFRAFVLIVHHIGLADDKRLRGHTSLNCAVDVQLLSERKEGEMSAIMTMQKLKDDESNVRFTAHLSRIVICQDEDGDEVSTLIVDRVEDGADAQSRKPAARLIPKSQRLLMEVVVEAIGEVGEEFQITNGPLVRVAPEEAIRSRYYSRVAEQAAPGESAEKLADRRLKSFTRAIKQALDAKLICACERNVKRYVWLP